MKIYCDIPNQFRGFRELESFNKVASANWSKTGQIFPMYDPETIEIFECAFNARYGQIVAFATVSIEQFRTRLEKQAQELLQKKVREAIIEASEDVSRIHSAISFVEQKYLSF